MSRKYLLVLKYFRCSRELYLLNKETDLRVDKKMKIID